MRKLIGMALLSISLLSTGCFLVPRNPAEVNRKNVYTLTDELGEYRVKDPKYREFEKKNGRKSPQEVMKELRDKNARKTADELVEYAKKGK